MVVHSIWRGRGFLTAFRDDPFMNVGVIDFAGSAVVHMTGGATALFAAIFWDLVKDVSTMKMESLSKHL